MTYIIIYRKYGYVLVELDAPRFSLNMGWLLQPEAEAACAQRGQLPPLKFEEKKLPIVLENFYNLPLNIFPGRATGYSPMKARDSEISLGSY